MIVGPLRRIFHAAIGGLYRDVVRGRSLSLRKAALIAPFRTQAALKHCANRARLRPVIATPTGPLPDQVLLWKLLILPGSQFSDKTESRIENPMSIVQVGMATGILCSAARLGSENAPGAWGVPYPAFVTETMVGERGVLKAAFQVRLSGFPRHAPIQTKMI
jgi:hypothetical protein